ncbi:NADP-dependent oxidoreductase [Actinophytocola sp.]|uniref:NADP-dependent oxidoreductase n=1 Tax=Actinophytocola sp. TaxID=1872138 RepID=UPI002ED34484
MTTRTTRAVCLVRRPARDPVPEDFAIEERPLPALGAGQLLVRNVYLSVDPSLRGRLQQARMHYTHNLVPGEPLDGRALGEVVASRTPGIEPGRFVRHQLGWREHAVVEARHVSIVDPVLAPLPTWLGLLGSTGFTAYVGLLRAGELRPGDTVFVSAAAGAVGSAAGQFARLLGAKRVVGSAGSERKRRVLTEEFRYDGALDYRAERVRDGLARLAPHGIDLYFDNVGGEHLVAALHALRPGGRVALCGAMSRDGETHDLRHLMQAVLKRITLRGFIVRDHEDLRPEFERCVAGWLASGELVARETVVEGLDNAVGAWLSMLRGGNIGKMLVQVGEA